MPNLFKPLILTACSGVMLVMLPLAGADLSRHASPFAAQAQTMAPAETLRQITVSGTGRVDLAPDMATIRIGVTHQDQVAAEALQKTSDSLAVMLERLAGLGVEARDVQTSNLSLNPVWRDQPGQQGQPAPWGFEASNVVTVRLRDLDTVGTVLDALVSDGANRLDGISFGLQESDAAQDEARRKAVEEAQRKAALYAEAAGVTLGTVVSLSETGGATPRPMMLEMAAMRADSVPVAAGEIGITASVQMVFALE